jgi:hypothetical protein
MRLPQRALKAILADDLVRPEIENEIRVCVRFTIKSAGVGAPAHEDGLHCGKSRLKSAEAPTTA